jgi:hypothetical protein
MLRPYKKWLAVVFAVVGYGLFSAGQAGATSFTWSGSTQGRTESAARWSVATNWGGGVAPVPFEILDTLTFPHLTDNECTAVPPRDTCYLTLNDVKGLTVDAMQLDDADNYLLAGEEITLGGGGIVAEPPGGAVGSAGAFVETPLELSAPQKWSIVGQGTSQIEQRDLLIGGEVTGAGKALTVELSSGPALILENSTEVGPIALEGPNSAGEHIDNGSVLLEEGELNSTDHEPVALRNIFFEGTGAVGALSTENATLDVGTGTYPTGGLDASSVTLDPTTGILFEITGGGTTARTDYSQLDSTGAVALGGEVGIFVSEPSAKASCPVLQRGQTYTFISTTAPLSGEFSNAVEHDVEELPIYFAKSCGQYSQTMRITYSTTGSVHTVTGTVEAEAVQKEATHRGELESAAARATMLFNQAEAERQAEKKKEEEAIAARNRKIQEEEAVAIARRRREEEEAETATGGFELSLVGSTIDLPKSGAPAVKLRCRGTRTCAGRLTLTVRHGASQGGKTSRETIGAAAFSISAGVTIRIKLALSARGRALVRTEHGPLGATLEILQSSPGPRRTHSQGVLVVRRIAKVREKR